NLRKAVSLDEARREDRRIPKSSYWPSALIYSDRVRYVEQLRRYHAVFPREQVLVLIYEDFRRDNEAIVRRVLQFLEVDDSHPFDLDRKSTRLNSSHGSISYAVFCLT